MAHVIANMKQKKCEKHPSREHVPEQCRVLLYDPSRQPTDALCRKRRSRDVKRERQQHDNGGRHDQRPAAPRPRHSPNRRRVRPARIRDGDPKRLPDSTPQRMPQFSYVMIHVGELT